jgi:hypothetical protein
MCRIVAPFRRHRAICPKYSLTSIIGLIPFSPLDIALYLGKNPICNLSLLVEKGTAMSSHPRDIVEQGFEQDRQDYWAMREELLAKYPGKWVAVHKGRVVAVGDDPLSLMDHALAEDGYAYTNKVGAEDKIVIRQRRVSFPE